MDKICLIPGDGIGRDVVFAAAEVLGALGLGLQFLESNAGFGHFQKTGDAIPDSTLSDVANAGVALFGATSSPSGIVLGYRSPILTMRQTFDLYANLRPVFSLPGNFSRPEINLMVVRENTEGLYAGRERQDGDLAIAERLVTRMASERIARIAFQQANNSQNGSSEEDDLLAPIRRAFNLVLPENRSVTVVHKANVLKLTDGLFRAACLGIASEFPRVSAKEMLVDAAAMRLVQHPENFDLIVTTNLFGDILSDEASALVGGLGVAPSANLGETVAVFEPVHGSAPDIAGQGIANPMGTVLSAALLLAHIHQPHAAYRVAHAVRLTIEDKILPPDLGGQYSTEQVKRRIIDHL